MTTRTYRNTLIHRAGPNSMGLRYEAFVWTAADQTHRVRADTLANVKYMITDTLAAHGLTRSVD